jgi:hypothetical protein
MKMSSSSEADRAIMGKTISFQLKILPGKSTLPIVWRPVPSSGGERPFRNLEAFKSLVKAATLLYLTDERIKYFSLGLNNEEHVILNPINAINMVFGNLPAIVTGFVKTTLLGKGNYSHCCY